MNKRTRKLILTAIAVLAFLTIAFIFSNSLKDSTESSEQSLAFKRMLLDIVRVFGFRGDINMTLLRNAAHVTEFAMLGTCLSALSIYFARQKGKPTFLRYLSFVGLSIFGCLVVAVVDELIQLTSAGRASDVKDVLLDLSGAVIGAVVAAIVYFLFLKIYYMLQKNKFRKNT